MPTAALALVLPGCKSSSQRALVLAATASGESRIVGLSDCRDSADLRGGLEQLGVAFSASAEPDTLAVRGRPPQEWEPARGAGDLPAGEGASTLRFLLALLAAGRADVRLRLAPALAARPHQELLELLRGFGATMDLGEDERGPWMRVRGAGGFGARTVEIPSLRSSQTLSALWMAAGDAPITWRLTTPLGSRGYVDLTVEMLRRVRGQASLTADASGQVWNQAAGYGSDARLRVLSDPSAVVFFAVAAMLLRRGVRVARAWNPRHADAALLRRLRQEDWLTWVPEESGITLVPGPSVRQRELVLDLDEAPDCGPALAVLAAHLPSGARFQGLDRLRIKESDRVAAMVRLAEACGATAREEAGWLVIQPGPGRARLGRPAPRRGAQVAAHGDHRTAMAAGIASLLHPGLEPDDPACAAKSFPRFWDELARLRA